MNQRILRATLVALTALAISCGTALAEVTYLQKWGRNGGDGSSGSGPGEFGGGDGLALSNDGHIYVTDGNSNLRVQKFDLDGNYASEWSVPGNARGLSTDSAGNVYLVRQFGGDLVKYDSSGNQLQSVGGLAYPHGVEVAADDKVFVAALFNNQVRRYDTNFNLEASWYVNYVYDVGFDSNGDLYAVSLNDSNIQKFDVDGNAITSWAHPSPGRIEISDNDRVYVTDAGSQQVGVFDTSGNPLENWGTGGLGDGEFNGPSGIGITSTGHIYVLDTSNYRIQRFFDSAAWVSGTNDFTNSSYGPTDVEINGSDANLAKGYVGMGSSLALGSGMELLVGGATSIRNGGSLSVLGGEINSPNIYVDYGGRLEGTGTITGDVSVSGTLAPGSSPGTMTVSGNSSWEPGGNYEWEINHALGTAGSDPGWDLYDISGTLTITATSDSPFEIDVLSLMLSNDPGLVEDFDETLDHSWTIAAAGGGVSGFDSSVFSIDASGFANSINGSFGIELVDNSINLTYQAVPEPASVALLALGIAAATFARRRSA